MCRKHDPVPAIDLPEGLTQSDRIAFLLSGGDKWVRCKHCGLLGSYTNGRQKGGARRPRWCHPTDGAYATERVASLTKWVAERAAAATPKVST